MKTGSISDQDHNQALKITQNLHTALLHLRDRDVTRVLRVDAIDQSNKGEKGHQIEWMAEIYASASRVIVWLGEPKYGSDDALMAIQDAARSERITFVPPRRPGQGILALFERPWFTRIWVREPVSSFLPEELRQMPS